MVRMFGKKDDWKTSVGWATLNTRGKVWLFAVVCRPQLSRTQASCSEDVGAQNVSEVMIDDLQSPVATPTTHFIPPLAVS